MYVGAQGHLQCIKGLQHSSGPVKMRQDDIVKIAFSRKAATLAEAGSALIGSCIHHPFKMPPQQQYLQLLHHSHTYGPFHYEI